MDVATPPVAGIQNPSPQLSAKVDQLHSEVTRLQELVKSLTRTHHNRPPSRRPSTPRPTSPHSPTSPRSSSPNNSATTKSMVSLLGSASPHVRCQTTWPLASGDKRWWPLPQSPFSHH